ncbi:uracil-DNA glycosylase family protein [Corynebacterium sp. HS2168-gen11]|uniref:uracil-DNA glycosylase family protein n=1 Tax=Corynebacterium sp. HS2168-gen11 TaxID=2974027 RepID=UPI00216AF62D|nr:uracil-DNA glycosylase family protein [Corynebacterium sp. HS2168-gen11]MCS4535800.1 uracil-DNA glycosylase family protein [Corynebacterium sp. HS2168-gen11]
MSWDIYEELRTLDISDSSIPDDDISSRQFRLGQAASWARWGATRHDLTSITADNHVEFQTLAPLTTSVVFLGVNWGGTKAADQLPDWRNFHTERHKGDKRLSKSLPPALECIPHDPQILAPAPYMTDVFKLIPTVDGSSLEKKISHDAAQHDHIQRCAQLLEAELDICTRGNHGIPPLLIALGNHAYDWLTGQKRGSDPIVNAVANVCGVHKPRIMKIYHGSASKPDDLRTEKLISVLQDNRQFFQ